MNNRETMSDADMIEMLNRTADRMRTLGLMALRDAARVKTAVVALREGRYAEADRLLASTDALRYRDVQSTLPS